MNHLLGISIIVPLFLLVYIGSLPMDHKFWVSAQNLFPFLFKDLREELFGWIDLGG